MSAPATISFSVNGRTYTPPARPIVVICLDGSADEYFDATLARGRMPNLQRMAVRGHRGLARGALPSFTNVNNSSIVTGVPPSVHGIGGNFFDDTATGQEVMMNSAKYLRAGTILAAAAKAGRKVGVITAKEKLRDIFSHDLKGIAFSSEKANQAKPETHGLAEVEKVVGRPTPQIYSAEASLYVFWSGAALLEQGLADFLYLSTTDYMQHAYAPESPESLDFYAAIDRELGRLLDLGALVGLTADHGMNAKQKSDGSPNVIYLESLLTERFGPGFRVILPITDPYVVHHGALGSFAVVHLPVAPDSPSPTTADRVGVRGQTLLEAVRNWLMDLPGVTEVYDRDTAARKLELPADRLGELVVLSGRNVVLGRTPEYHDLKALHGGLRSHGGRYEEMVPLILSEPLKPEYAAKAAGDPRNFDVFDFAINGIRT
jgi:phosphonoacetate hydrolase